MKKLIVIHKNQGRLMSMRVIEPQENPVVFGTSTSCDNVLIGQEVSPIHFMLEWRGKWIVADLGSASGTWYEDKNIVEQELQDESKIAVGTHEFSFRFTEGVKDLFQGVSQKSPLGADVRHHIVVKMKGHLSEVRVLPVDKPFEFFVNGEVKKFVAPQQSGEARSQFGDIEIIQSLISDIPTAAQEVIRIDAKMKWPTLAVGSILTVLLFVMFFAPTQPDVELDLPELKDNKYARMIFDAKLANEQKKQALKIVQKRMSHAGVAPTAEKSTAVTPKGDTKGAKVVSKIKATGISQLIGKIAKRTADAVVKTQVRGLSPDIANSGRALASIGGANTIKGVAPGPGNFQLKGVSTQGKGGGTGNYKDGAGLSGGSEGFANVGIIEEETEVEGGLDRSIIAEIIEKNLGQIRYCYERQLSADPNIYGKVLVKFDIGADGQVSTQTVGQSTLKNAMVEGCILRRVARWQFPQPKGGTTVRVTYPFLFKSNQ
ncbi:MAG: TonB family protein [Bdellovibrionales bacterium]|nr:TonB family protein [Bdellovibrionales bacterium]